MLIGEISCLSLYIIIIEYNRSTLKLMLNEFEKLLYFRIAMAAANSSWLLSCLILPNNHKVN